MSAALDPLPLTHSPPPSAFGRRLLTWVPVALFLVLWVDLIRQLSYTWETNEQYAYGWFVPFLACGLLLKRWLTRPSPQPPTFNFQLLALVVLLCLLWLPFRLVHEINPDWPFITWPASAIVVALSLLAVFFAGGWRWVTHFAFPVCFILVAVQWPDRIEHGLTQNLMQTVASLTVEITGLFGIPAFQRGNIIEVATGVVGVDEACSGIRSFQSTLMGALFLGELYRLKWLRRLSLLVGGVVLSFTFNVVRTVFLTWQASAHGISAIDKWHDSAGVSIFLISFASLWVIAGWLRRKSGDQPPPMTDKLRIADPQLPDTPARFPTVFLVAVGLWAILCLAATELWYRSQPETDTAFVHWSVMFPEDRSTFQTVKLPLRTSELLAYDSGTAAKWQEEDGSEWAVYFFQWQGKSIQSIMAARYHRPEVCLPASGLKQASASQTDYFEAQGLKMPFRKSSYSTPGQVIHVFYCIWQDGDEHREGMRSRDRGDRLLGAMEGRRRFAQQVLEIVTSGYADAADAERAVRRRLPGLIRIEKPRGNQFPSVATDFRRGWNG